jgi:bifunctional aspartokinase / homoserine dehydrogenase 1
MIGVPGVAQRLFGSLHQMGISVILISQASSEHSICVAIDAKHTAAATVSNSIHIYLHAQCLFR